MPRQLGREVVIVEAARTPIGRGYDTRGRVPRRPPNTLLGTVYEAVIARAGIAPELVDDVVCGCVSQVGEQSNNIARNAWLQAGLPATTPAATVDRQCGSGQQAITFAAGMIAMGGCDIAIGAGVEHMGRVPMGANVAHADEFGTPFPDSLMERYQLVPQGLAAEMVADHWNISRAEQDELGLRSHQLAAKALAEDRFAREIAAVEVNGVAVTCDQGIRFDTSIEKLAALKPAFKAGGTVTPGNSSQISDGAAAVLLMARETADELGLRPRARIFDTLTVGVDPVMAAPAGGRAHDHEVDALLDGLAHDRVAERAGPHDLAVDLDAVLRGELLRVGERLPGVLLLGAHLGVQRQLHRHADHVDRADARVVLLGQPDRGGEHLLADRAELHRDEDAGVLALLAWGTRSRIAISTFFVSFSPWETRTPT